MSCQNFFMVPSCDQKHDSTRNMNCVDGYAILLELISHFSEQASGRLSSLNQVATELNDGPNLVETSEVLVTS